MVRHIAKCGVPFSFPSFNHLQQSESVVDISLLPPETLSQITEVASRTAHTILQSYADDIELPTNWRTTISFRLQNDDLFHVQRTGCDLAVIFVNGYEFLTLDKSDKSRVGKFKFAALKAIKLAASLSKNGNALITGDLAYAITKERQKLRREVISIGYNALDDRYFHLSGTITLTDRLGGRQVTSEIVSTNIIPLEVQVIGLKHSLSLLMLQDSETEEIIDILELARQKQANPIVTPTPVSYTISNVENGIATHVDYHTDSLIGE